MGLSTSRSSDAGQGFTLLEVVIAMTVLLMVLFGFSQSVLTSMRSPEADHEVVKASATVKGVLERMSAANFEDTFALYNADPEDDPGGPGSADGAGFAVPGLDVAEGDVDGLVGEIIFPAIEDAFGVPQIREDYVDARLGMPRDLNGDGQIDSLDHSNDYRILPVRVVCRWRGVGGGARTEFKTLLGPR